MPDLSRRLWRLVTTWRGDALLAAALLAWSAAYLPGTAGPAGRRWLALVFLLAVAAAVAVRRRWPFAAAAVICAALLAVRPLGLYSIVEGAAGAPLSWTPILIAYSLGASAGLTAGLAGEVLLVVGLQVQNKIFNPIFYVAAAGGWAAGRIVLTRGRLTEQLRARNDELEAERELFAQESVRYERARIAREVHDIVAHCLSGIVVQASAGQRLPEADQAGLTEALESVAEAAAQAQSEVGMLTALLGGEASPGASPGLAMVTELVRRACLTGLDVSCQFAGACDRLTAAASEAAYRVVQEALTNALKHAPGAPVDITVREQGHDVEVSIVNAVPQRTPSGLEGAGGRYGLAGMRDRVTACGGSLTAGPTPAGGWRVAALLPGEGSQSL